MTPTPDLRQPALGSARFATTQWTVVLTAAGAGSTAAHAALSQLCQRYWYPLYAYIRRSGHSTHAAEDLTQEYFTRLLQKQTLADVDREKGKFRSFLLASLKHFLANENDRAQTLKRGGHLQIVSLDADSADNRYRLEPTHSLTPDKLFERRWAMAVLEQVLARLSDEQVAAGKQTLFEHFKPFLTADRSELTYDQVAAKLAMTEGAVKVALHRLRKRYRELLRDEIGQTVSNPAEIDEELRYLQSCL
ncbi:MAG: sigma-70 family RNA polymerase sigma factor [Planctomycetes bacterium]|nr:sigma-70 family RNA polymerase sigma factor [Planctomycetota bacterium]